MSGDPLWSGLKSGVAGVDWPPLIRGPAAALALLVRQLEDSQWRDPAEIETAQFRQLRALAAYAGTHAPHFAARLREAGLSPSDLVSQDALRRLPLLTRRDLQSMREEVYCREVPADHLPVHENRTSGSTGEPVVVKRTAVCQLFWLADTMREYFWHEREFSWRFTAIRPQFTKYVVQPNWGQPANLLFETGPAQFIPITADIGQQVDWIEAFDPHVLLVYPNVLDGILRHCRMRAMRFRSLKLIRSISETLSPRLREEAASFFGVRIVENYSAQEAGIIAVQCPDSDAYHVMSESVMVEVLNEKGRPCEAGETGRVIVTDLHNFATPIIRYEIGDYAQVAPHCICGRGLPGLKRIVGRERNLICMPDGTRHYPLVGFARFREVASVVQYQVIQHDLERIEVRLVTEVPLTASQEGALRDIIVEALGHPFQISFSYFQDRILRGANGKFEEFVSLLPAP